MTHPSDIAGLSERLEWLSSPLAEGMSDYQRINNFVSIGGEIKDVLDSLSARVKELEAELRDWQDSSEAYRKDFEAAESRALRAKQQRDEAYERAAKVADGYCGVNFPPQYQHAEIIADAIRRLASGPDNGAKP